MNEKKFIYIAGKISGENYRECYSKFNRAQTEVESRFEQPAYNPMKRVPQNWSWIRQMFFCIRAIKKHCNKIYFLKDWKESKGARWEHRVAKRNNIKIYYEQ